MVDHCVFVLMGRSHSGDKLFGRKR